MANLLVIKAGLHTSIQDLGRYGYRQFGVPLSGCMDRYSAQMANLLVNNDENAALLEITIQGPKLKFTATTLICITGGDLSPAIDDLPVPINIAMVIHSNQYLTFGKPKYGVRCYLSVKGGFQLEKTLDSYSQYQGITRSSKIEEGNVLQYAQQKTTQPSLAKPKVNFAHFQSETLEVSPGPEFDLLNHDQKKILIGTKWQIGPNSRMGYQLLSTSMPVNSLGITTSQVVPGTIQLTPSGKLMALMRDAQVTGGYPRVLQLTKRSIDRLAQKSTNQTVQFMRTEKSQIGGYNPQKS